MSAGTVLRVAAAVFRESVRDRVLYNLVGFAILIIGASYLIGQLTAGQDVKIIKDLGLAAMSIFGLFISIFIGIGLVSKEVERRSVYSLLAKPVRRSELVVGKYAGLVLTVLVNLAIMAVVLYLVLAYMDWMENPEAKKAWDEWLAWLTEKGKNVDWTEVWNKYQEYRKKGEAKKKKKRNREVMFIFFNI